MVTDIIFSNEIKNFSFIGDHKIKNSNISAVEKKEKNKYALFIGLFLFCASTYVKVKKTMINADSGIKA